MIKRSPPTKIFAFILLSLCFFLVGCKRLPPSTTFKQITLKLEDFIQDCKYGDSNYGVSTSDVNYTVNIKVYQQLSNGSYNAIATKTYSGSAPSGDIKSIFTKDIEVPTVSFKLVVTVDATDCSLCLKSFCKPNRDFNYSTMLFFWSNVGKPYWRYENLFVNGNISNQFTAIPTAYPRNPNQVPICECTIKY